MIQSMKLGGLVLAIFLAAACTQAINSTDANGDDVQITAENVSQIVDDRLAILESHPLKVDGEARKIEHSNMDGTEIGLSAILGAEGYTLAIGIEDLIQGKDDIESFKAQLVNAASGDLYSGDMEPVSEEGGVLMLAGTLTNRDGVSKKVEAGLSEAIISRGDAKISVEGDRLFLTSTLGYGAYYDLKQAIASNPDAKTLVIADAPGSIDDAVNMHTARLVRDAGLTTYVPAGAEISSGAVDLFASGAKRIAEKGAKLGVHSWCCTDDGTGAADLSRDDPAHAAQLAYFTEMLGTELGPEFYFFTLNAAPADDIKVMTDEELIRYNLATEIR